MDDEMHATPTADMELEQRLDAYARARLSIHPDTAARIRERVMYEARNSLAGATTAPGLSIVGSRASAQGDGQIRARLRRGGALLLAAGLAMGVLGGTAAAAQPGGPLYSARVWVEAATLPGDPTERAAAELRRLETRLAEIQSAARSGDRGAVAAAIAAYGDIADEALAEAGTDASMLGRLRIALDRHLAVLQAVAASAPSQASEAIQRNIDRAVERNDATLETIAARTPPPSATQGGGGNQGGANQGGGNQGAGANPPANGQNPDATATPDVTKKPHPTAKPGGGPDAPPAVATPVPTPDPTDHPNGDNRPPKPSPKSGGK